MKAVRTKRASSPMMSDGTRLPLSRLVYAGTVLIVSYSDTPTPTPQTPLPCPPSDVHSLPTHLLSSCKRLRRGALAFLDHFATFCNRLQLFPVLNITRPESNLPTFPASHLKTLDLSPPISVARRFRKASAPPLSRSCLSFAFPLPVFILILLYGPRQGLRSTFSQARSSPDSRSLL